ncbi:type II toxin-antitoxin system YafO family toxin [Pasteurella multocida]|uniref:type II toxin-antitoxin system YafO family toxin n=1 Tax=Pasteurella multocida TaxID=747 RepID=UPI00397C1743
MNSRVLIHSDLHHIPYIERIAVGIALFQDTGKYPDFLGHFGQFENNSQAMNSLLYKIHIALYSADWNFRKWKNRNGHNRTSDNFVIYAKHFFCDDYYLILDIVHPEAHKRIDKLLPNLIQKAEEFHKLRGNELRDRLAYSADNYQITETINLTN